MKPRSDKIPMVGKRYGDLLVLADAPFRGCTRYVLVRCKCGREYEAPAQSLRVGRTKRCARCRDEANVLRGKAECSVRLPDGRTIAQIADAAGLPIGTVYRRFLRGWPPEYLGVEKCGRGAPKPCLGGSIDAPERRRTKYPDHANGRRAEVSP